MSEQLNRLFSLVEALQKDNDELKLANKDLQVRVLKLEKSVKVKAKKWDVEEDRYLCSLAARMSLDKDTVRRRDTIYLKMVQLFQQNYERTERAITMRLDQEYFGK